MYETALAHRNAHTYDVTTYEEFKTTINEKPGFIRAMWCGCQECEDKIKEDTAATARCIPFEQEEISGTCVCCGKPAKKMGILGKSVLICLPGKCIQEDVRFRDILLAHLPEGFFSAEKI